jgi:hypothetical protein
VVAAWRPEGNVGRMFGTIVSHLPPPEGFQPPPLWGTGDHVREIFDGTGIELELEPTTVEFTADSPEAYFEEIERDLPPIVMAKTRLEPEGKWEPLRDDLMKLYTDSNESDTGFRSAQEYLIIKGTKG